ncbi:MAG: HPr-rel-A system PqqD family peptide chaperone [Planctomycetota bacterium]|nr:HPr-rel-A system PqqD family peptide chaperone [Planctomycetota bacterium]
MPSLSRLSVSPEGLAFDPATGDTFLLNPTALLIVKTFQSGGDQAEVVRVLTERYQVAATDAERDVADFRGRLKTLGLL